MEKTCSTCIHWLDYCQAFNDLEEPRDSGYCQNSKKSKKECTSEDDTCDHWEPLLK